MMLQPYAFYHFAGRYYAQFRQFGCSGVSDFSGYVTLSLQGAINIHVVKL
jgi:hypothetical protein